MSVLTKARTAEPATASDTRLHAQPMERGNVGGVFLRDKDRLLFSPKYFFWGTVIGFAICCLLGWLTTTKNQFGNIHRFEVYCSPAAYLYPTLAEMLAMAREKSAGGKTLVVLGGSSIFNGVGQTDADLWSVRLQQLLGPKYAVLNFAQRSCCSFDGGYYAAEALIKEGRKAIFVTVGRPHGALNPLGDPLYAHVYWDAFLTGNLMPDPQRERTRAEQEKHLPDGVWTQDSLTEMKLSRLMNRLFYTSELWNAVSWRYFASVYNIYAANNSFKALKKLVPYENFEVPSRSKLDFGLWATRAISSTNYTWDAVRKCWVEVPESWDGFRNYCALPAGMRGRVLYCVIWPDAFYWKHLTDQELQRQKLTFRKARDILKSLGIASFECGADFQQDDYVDWQHLSAKGGRKLAEQTAAGVVKLAHSLGYN